MRRIGIYGGTFNPPHIGHLRLAQYALQALALDKILIIPDRIPPHKQMPEDAPSPEQRMDMLKLLTAGEAQMEVSAMELCREGPSYTYETVEQVCACYPDAELFLLMGSDMLISLQKWKEYRYIICHTTIAAFLRGIKAETEQLVAAKELLESEGAKVILMDNPVTDISSTDLRRLLVFQCAEPYLTSGVNEYIRKNGLYGTARDYRKLSVSELEQTVSELLNPDRIAHTRGCAQTCVQLARRYGANETDAVRAGLLHDITKALNGQLQLTLCRVYGMMLDDFSAKNPKTLHALTGSLVAERIFGEDKAVVAAICSHTTGKADMNILEKILYVADYMEPNRDFPGVEALRNLAYADITKALKLGLTMTLDMLHRQQREISPETKDALRFLESTGV